VTVVTQNRPPRIDQTQRLADHPRSDNGRQILIRRSSGRGHERSLKTIGKQPMRNHSVARVEMRARPRSQSPALSPLPGCPSISAVEAHRTSVVIRILRIRWTGQVVSKSSLWLNSALILHSPRPGEFAPPVGIQVSTSSFVNLLVLFADGCNITRSASLFSLRNAAKNVT
jgi:hypothetical protein